MPEKIEIYIEGKDGLSHPAQAASRSLSGLSSAASSTSRSLGGLGGAMGTVALQAAALGTAIVGVMALSGLVGMIKGAIGGMIGINAEMETMQQSFTILLSDAAAAGGGVTQAQEDIGQATRSTAAAVANAQERMADSAEDHQLALEALAADFVALESESTQALSKMAQEYAASLASMTSNHARFTDDTRRQLDAYSRDFAQQSESRQRQFDQELAQRRQRLNEELSEINARYNEQAKTAPDRFLREKAAAKANAEFLRASIAEEEAKGTGADQALLASLKSRLADEEALQKMSFTDFTKQEKTKKDAAENAARARAAAEEAVIRNRYDFESRLARQNNDERIAELQRRMAQENADYTKALGERQSKYDEDLADYKVKEAEKLEALKEREAAETRQYARIVRDTLQAMAAAGASYAEAATKATQSTGGAVNQMEQMFDNLAKFVGRPLDTAQDRAAAMLEFIKKKAKETPFDIPDIQHMVQRLLAYQLDATIFLDTVGNVAAGMGVPIQQVADAFGALATGQMGESVMRFREFGVNLRGIAGLKFDAQGALVTPISEALTIVKAAMDTRFGGMMSEQAKTFTGITSNLRDAWGQFLLVVGKPVFEEVRGALKGLMDFMDANDANLKEFGVILGRSLADGLKQLGPMAQDAMTGILEWLQSGRAVKDAKDFATTSREIVDFLVKAIKFGGDFVGWLINIAKWIRENRILVGDILLGLGLLAVFLGGPLVLGIVAVMVGFALFGDKVIAGVKNLMDWFGVFGKAIGDMWDGAKKSAETSWQAFLDFGKGAINTMIGFFNRLIKAWNDLEFTVPEIDLPLIGKVGGWSVGTPDIPYIPTLDSGGIVRERTLAILAANNKPEAVVPLNAGMAGVTVQFYQQAPIYGFANFQDAIVSAVEQGRRAGRI